MDNAAVMLFDVPLVPGGTRAMRHDAIFFVLYLMVIGALLITQAPRTETKSVTTEDKAPVAVQDKAPVVDKPDDGVPQGIPSVSKGGLAPDCEKELRRTADLLRFFANRIQSGEDVQSIVADMRQQEKKVSAVCE
jgi:hypothetical protein